MSACWYVRIMGEVLGPYGNDTLREMVRANRITPSDELRRDDGPWVPANEVWELFTNDASNDPLDRIALEAVSDGRAAADARPSTRTDEPTRCPYCRETIHHGARKCRPCGETLDLKLRRLHNSSQVQAEPEQKAVVLALLLFLGGFIGLHRFYVGKVASGVVILGFGLTEFGLIVTIPWSLVDLAFVLLGRFTDVEGNALV